MSDSPLPMMICRSANEPPYPGAVRGYFCGVCGDELQVTPTGQSQLKQMPGVLTFCNPCGIHLTTTYAKMGKLEAVVISPELQAKLDGDPQLKAKFDRELGSKLK